MDHPHRESGLFSVPPATEGPRCLSLWRQWALVSAMGGVGWLVGLVVGVVAAFLGLMIVAGFGVGLGRLLGALPWGPNVAPNLLFQLPSWAALLGGAMAGGLAGGCILGYGQQRLLQRLGGAGRGWLVATMVGVGLTTLAVPLAFLVLPAPASRWEPVVWWCGGGIGGLVLGAAQGSVLRRTVRRAGWWIPVTALSAIVGNLPSLVLVGPGLQRWAWPWLLVGTPLGWTFHGLVSGPALCWLLRHPHTAMRPAAEARPDGADTDQ